MNSERPHDLRSWDELLDSEKSRYFLLTDEELAIVKPMNEDERAHWYERKRFKQLIDLMAPMKEKLIKPPATPPREGEAR
jgi:hypothetical protein